MVKRLFFLVPVSLILCCSLTFLPFSFPVSTDFSARFKHISGHLSVIHNGPPADLTFCGEPVPVSDPQVGHRLEREIQRHVRHEESTRLTIRRAFRYQEEFTAILRQMGVPEDFFYLALAESGLSNASSPKGAQGFWQFMAPAAERYGLEVSETVDERYHPQKSTYAACRYLLDSYEEFGSWSLVAASYNMGAGGLQKAIREQAVADYFSLDLNRETGNYLYRVLGYKCIFEHPGRYGFSLSEAQGFRPLAFRVVKVQQNISDLATFAAENGADLATLRLLNPWLIAERLDAKPNKVYEIRFPVSGDVYAPELIVKRFSAPDTVASGTAGEERIPPAGKAPVSTPEA
jgi:hypothetical protein